MQAHPYHMVKNAPWPFLAAMSSFVVMSGAVLYIHNVISYILPIGLIMLISVLYYWWVDVVNESMEGHHTLSVQTGLKYGVIFFILSEVFFFVAFFWAFFNSSIYPAVELGCTWPPKGIEPLNAWDVPFLNTLILLLSGVTVTWAHHSLLNGNRTETAIGLALTVVLGVIFSTFQAFEYAAATFTISDGAYGTTFYLATGFHGVHVLIGTIFLSVCLVRHLKEQFTRDHHVGLEAAAWYWHFVDVVWILLFASIYCWGQG